MLMAKQTPHGVIDQSHLNRKTDYLFRISIKCVISNANGQVLVVQEDDRTWWDLPGGGMDHGEDLKAAIARELNEEAGLKGEFEYRVLHVENPAYLEHANVMQLRMIFKVIPHTLPSKSGVAVSKMTYIDPEKLKNSDNLVERKVYEYATLAYR